MKIKTYQIFRNGTHHATITAINKTDAKQGYSAIIGNYNFELYEIKQYVFIYEDKQGNELTREVIEADNIQEARKYAKDICFNSMLNDLHKVRVKRIY
jgi:hypothetical protein